jgi:hypothetical protein
VLPQLGQLRRLLDALKVDFVEFFIAVRLLSWIADLVDCQWTPIPTQLAQG